MYNNDINKPLEQIIEEAKEAAKQAEEAASLRADMLLGDGEDWKVVAFSSKTPLLAPVP